MPRTKEGGMATIAWLLMAVHVCSLPETHEQAIISGQRPMVALLASLAAFFHHYAVIDGLDGVLMFAPDGSSSEFRKSADKKASSPHASSSSSAWGELSVLDPTREGAESLNLAPRLPPATQVLMSYELRRASQRLQRVPKGREMNYGDGRMVLEEVFEPLADSVNVVPSFTVGSMGIMGALVLWDQDSKGAGNVELAIIDTISPRPGWAATGCPFLHRNDDRSQLFARVLEIEERTGRAVLQKSPEVELKPCHFICRVNLEKDGRNWRLDSDGVERLQSMRRYIADRNNHAQAHAAAQETALTNKVAEEQPATTTSENIAKLPSPSRARTP